MNLNNKYIFDGSFGLERETLRVDSDGSLAATPHPFSDDKTLDRDFCENQLELITPVCTSIDELIDTVTKLDKTARNGIGKNNEYLWMMSNPPHFETEDDIKIANYSGNKAFKHDYRLNLERRYGKRIMLYSGIHYNFSFSDRLVESLSLDGDPVRFKNELYFRLAKHVSRCSWLLVLLTAASPVYDLSFNGNGLHGTGFDGIASMRSSERGYWNKFIPILNYNSPGEYSDSIESYIQKGALFSVGELYLPVRLKPKEQNSLQSISETGVDHIELRMLDINPLSPIGVFKEDLEFIHYFLIYLSSLPDFEFTPKMQEIAVKNHKAASKYDLKKIQIDGRPVLDEAYVLLGDMKKYFYSYPDVICSIDRQIIKLTENNRYCVKIYEKYHENYHNDFLKHLKSGKEN